MDFLTSTLPLILVVFSAIYFYIKHLYSYWHRHGFPYLKPKIPYGNLLGFGQNEQFALLLDRLYQQLKGQGPVGGIYFMHKPFALALDIDFIKQMLIKDFHHFEDRGLYYNEKAEPISAHLFAVDAEQWRHLRNKVSPTFTSGKMKFMFPTIINVTKELEKTFAKQIRTNEQEVDLEIRDILARFTIDVIGTCAFGFDCNSLNDPNTEFKTIGMKAFEERNFSIAFSVILSTYPALAKRLGIRVFLDCVSNFFTSIVHDTINYRQKNNVKRNDFMDLLLKLISDSGSDDTLTMNEIVAQSFVFFIAGFETSSTTMTYALYELAKNQDVQEKLRTEINAVIRKFDGEFSYEAMTEMHYLDQVINETLRKHPPVGQLVRRVTKEYQIPGTSKVLQKDQRIFVPVYSIHHDPELFPNPEKFLPERFSQTSNLNQQSNYISFLAFGHGPRNCVGLRFGMLQARCGLVSILLKYNISISSKTMEPLEYSVKNAIMAPKCGMWLKLKKI